MAGSPNHQGDGFEAENTSGLLGGFLAEEEDLDRRSLWRLGSWGAGAVAAVVIAVLANQSAFRSHLDQIASDDLARQAQQLRTVARESQNEARRLASAVETLNGDRDRLYSRVTVLEQGLDSVTGSIARQNATVASPQVTVAAPAAPAEPQSTAQNPAPPAVVAPVATTAAATVASVQPTGSNTSVATPATPLMASKSMMAPDAAAGKLIEPEAPANSVTAAPMPEVAASIPSADTAEQDAAPAAAPKLAIQRTEFGVDVGTANSLGGLRALWRGLLQSNAPLAALRPVIAIKEGSNGLGMQLRLVAGPLSDAAAAAKICAALTEGHRTCETTVFDGQRLAMRADEPPAVKPAPRRRSFIKPAASAEPPKKPDIPTLSSLFSRR
jgi:hypothetical protein